MLTGGERRRVAVRGAPGFRRREDWLPHGDPRDGQLDARESWGFAQGIVHSFSRIGNAVTPPLMAGLLVFSSWRTSFAILGW
jgi:hypothetical protein